MENGRGNIQQKVKLVLDLLHKCGYTRALSPSKLLFIERQWSSQKALLPPRCLWVADTMAAAKTGSPEPRGGCHRSSTCSCTHHDYFCLSPQSCLAGHPTPTHLFPLPWGQTGWVSLRVARLWGERDEAAPNLQHCMTVSYQIPREGPEIVERACALSMQKVPGSILGMLQG